MYSTAIADAEVNPNRFLTLSSAFPHDILGADHLAGEMTARAGQGPQNSLLFILFPDQQRLFYGCKSKAISWNKNNWDEASHLPAPVLPQPGPGEQLYE